MQAAVGGRGRLKKCLQKFTNRRQQQLPCCRKWPTASGSSNNNSCLLWQGSNGRNGNGNSSGSGSGKFRTVKSFVAARALESFAEIQINKMQHENCNLQLAS